jgi:shikimate kinase
VSDSAKVAPAGPIVLVGLMATGKSTVGNMVATALGRQFFDSDAMVEARAGRTVAQLWEQGGEPAFRGLETEVLDEALTASPPGVVAAAGGVVLSAANRARLLDVASAGGVVVWLRADPDLLASRVSPGDHRPLLAEDPVGVLHRMASERGTLYAEVADRVIDVDGLSVDETVRRVLGAVADVAAARAASRR